MPAILPDTGFVFWPVGNGDSTTVAINKKNCLQVDLNHVEESEDDDDHRTPVIDELIDCLPRRNGRPYLAAFACTHPDEDHCRGAARLFKEINVGELWVTSRLFTDTELSEAAKALRKEARRRVKASGKSKSAGSGDRIRIFGFTDDIEELSSFPSSRVHAAGDSLREVDGKDLSDNFEAYIHAPYEETRECEPNASSLALQIMLTRDGSSANGLFFGDLAYAQLRRIFDSGKKARRQWNILLAPHHCSKAAMYVKPEDDKKEARQEDILDSLRDHRLAPAFLLSSSEPIPKSDSKGDNPPHAKAKRSYEEVLDQADDFLCTQEHPNVQQPEPIVLELSSDGLAKEGPAATLTKASDRFGLAIVAARGTEEPPKSRTGYGSVLE